jgi:hypothetical protein
MVDQAKRNVMGLYVMLAVLALWNVGLTYQVVVTSIAARKAHQHAEWAYQVASAAHGGSR